MRLDADMALVNLHAALHFWSWSALGRLRCAEQAIIDIPALEPYGMPAIAEVCRLLDDIEAAAEKIGWPLRGQRDAANSRGLEDTAEPHAVAMQCAIVAVDALEAVAKKADGTPFEVQAKAAAHESRRLLAEVERDAPPARL